MGLKRIEPHEQLILLLVCMASWGCSDKAIRNGIALNAYNVIEKISFPSDLSAAALNVYGSTAGKWGSGAGQWGEYSIADGILRFERTPGYAGVTDFALHPDSPNLRYRFGDLREISVDVKLTLNTADNGYCGLSLAFGSEPGHINAALLAANLRMAGRDWAVATHSNKTPRDLIRFFFSPFYTISGPNQGDWISIDNLINAYNRPSGEPWNSAIWTAGTGSFQVAPQTEGLATGGDWMSYRFKLEFDQANHAIAIAVGYPTSSPASFASNLSTSTWTPQTQDWHYAASPTATESGQARGGIDFTNLGTVFDADSLNNEGVTIGFNANRLVKSCEFSRMKIETR